MPIDIHTWESGEARCLFCKKLMSEWYLIKIIIEAFRIESNYKKYNSFDWDGDFYHENYERNSIICNDCLNALMT